MNLQVVLLVLCLAGNALLAFALFRPATAATTNPNQPTAAHHNSTASQNDVSPAATLSQAEMAFLNITNAADFSWSQFTAADYAHYIKQLRVFGTPEARVREIIIGAIDSVYRPKRAALMPPANKKADDGKFWKRRNFYSVQPQQTKEQREQMRLLRKEQTDLVKSLFGADIFDQMAKDSGSNWGIDWTEKMYGFLPKELREKVQEVEQRMNEETQAVYANAQEDNDWQYQQSDLRKIQKKYHDELAKVLTPEQLLEWDLRHSQTANQLKNDLSAFDPNEDEFRALFKYQQAMEEVNPQRDPDADPTQLTAEQRKANAEKQKTVETELASLIGTNRLAEYKIEQDYSYRQLLENGVAKESVFKLADIKKEAESAARKIRNDKTLTQEQRTEALAAIRTETQTSMGGLLDEKQLKRYINNGGWWLNNIAPKPQAIPVQ